ncbi:MAG: DUF1318 domain-containing protein [Deltaproteobacteria bacterium]|nr:DUF1318 domain-containing protein [Deltaproteobacteria bacterium]
MKKNQKFLWSTILCMMVFILACVTVNIYFPAEQVETMAGEIVDEIRGQEGAEKQSFLINKKVCFVQSALQCLSPSNAWAQDATTVSNATIRGLKEKMKARYAQLKPFYQNGMLQEGDDGYISIAGADELGLKEKRDLNALVDAENKDRGALYAEVARALVIDSSQINKVAEIFAREWQKPIR